MPTEGAPGKDIYFCFTALSVQDILNGGVSATCVDQKGVVITTAGGFSGFFV